MSALLSGDAHTPDSRRGEERRLAQVLHLNVERAAPAYEPLLRQRAELRLAAIQARDAALTTREKGDSVADVERAVVASLRAEHPTMKVSRRSIRRWAEVYRTQGLDGLVDGNDGSGRKGKSKIPREAQQHFFTVYLDVTRDLTIKGAIAETRAEGLKQGWKLPRRDDPFYRYAKTLESLVKALRKTAVDEPETVLDSVLRGIEQPYRTLQSDHHLVDVFVSCEGTVCGPEGCRSGHRPWWTPMMDVGSRKIISYRISLEVPNSTRVLEAFRLAVEKEGLPERFYCDNGKDFKKATGKGLTDDDRSFLENRFKALGVTVIWAKPYNAQAKAIERMFRTFVDQHWRSFESYVGRTGKRSAHAHHLYSNPELLPTFTHFCAELALRVELYNSNPHRGTGMNRRTPNEVFALAKRTRRDPERAAFALVFWRCETRTLDRHGIRVDNILYRLEDPDGSVTSRYFRERVKILIDPQDISRAIVCTADERFLCPAVVREYATHDFTEAVTQRENERVRSHNKTLRRRARSGDLAAQRHLAWLKQPANRLAALRALADQRRSEEAQVVAATGTETATTVLVSSFSRVARDYEAAAQPRSPLTPEERELAASVPAVSDEQLDRMLDEQRGRTSPPAPAPRSLRALVDADVEAEMARAARRRKGKEGLCLVEGCEEARTRVLPDVDECGRHWLAIHGQQIAEELGQAALAELRADIEREVAR